MSDRQRVALAGQAAMGAAGLVYLSDDQGRWDAFIRDMTQAKELGPAPASLTREGARQAAVELLGFSIVMLGNEGDT